MLDRIPDAKSEEDVEPKPKNVPEEEEEKKEDDPEYPPVEAVRLSEGEERNLDFKADEYRKKRSVAMSELGRILKGQGSKKTLHSKNVSFHNDTKEESKNVGDSKLEDRNLNIPDEDSFRGF